jgi:hypothetical protein
VSTIPGYLRGLVDDAAVFPPGNAPLEEALAAHRRHQSAPYAALVGPLVIGDRHLPELRRLVEGTEQTGEPLAVAVVVSGGAGALEPTARWADAPALRLAGLEVALRDSATGELAHNARRILAAVDALGIDPDDTPVYVEMPRLYGSPPTPDWFGALDELAAGDLRVKLRTGGEDADAFPSPYELGGCIEAALDRELPFKCTAGLHRAIRHRDDRTGFEHHGFLNVLAATRAALDGAVVDDLAKVLVEPDAAALTGSLDPDSWERARPWFRSFGSCSIGEPLEDLTALGLLETP